ncbi:M16 family metallopeptidase [Stenotrophomonas nitritireducens]|uniref:M16 family metallopeptidase n=1 Tax=Stenotrophomonas nitritireducens TaxID=83617 RepID=UPI003D962722
MSGAVRRPWLSVVLIGLCLATSVEAGSPTPTPTAVPANDPIDIAFETFTLPNGLRVIVHTDRKAPIVAVSVWYHVGSGDEPAGRTGFAHLFEHLMFRGTEHSPGDYYGPLQRVGATDVNATVTPERTNYFQVVPSTALDVVLWMESDRMGHLLGAIDQDALDTERAIVENEKRQRRGVPYGATWELLSRASYPEGHPFHHSTLGSSNDLRAATLGDVHDWFRAWYGPNNAVLVLSGDIDADTAREKVLKYFGHIPPGPAVTKHEIDIARRETTSRERVTDQVPQVRIHRTWNVAQRGTRDFDQLRMLAHILGGGSASRLGRRLVHSDRLVDDISAEAGGQLGSRFMIVANVREGVDPASVEAAIDEELERLLARGPSAAEVERARVAMRAEFVRSIERNGGIDGKAEVLAACEVLEGDAGCFRRSMEVLASARPEALGNAARRWLRKGDHVLTVVPGARAEIEEAPAAVPPPMHLGEPDPRYSHGAPAIDREQGPPVSEMLPQLKFPALERTQLSNGTQVILARRDDVPLVQMSYRFPLGHGKDASPSGVSGVAFNLLNEGAGEHDALSFAARAEALGAQLDSNVDVDAGSVNLSALSETLDASVALYADMVRRPRFDAAALERARANSVGAIRQEEANPQILAQRLLPTLLYGADHPYAEAFNGRGTIASIERLGRNDILEFHRTWVRPERATLVVVGDTTLEAVVAVLERHFGDWRGPGEATSALKPDDIPRPECPRVFLVDVPGAMQANIVVGQLIPPSTDSRTIAFEVANSILGGSPAARLNMNLREAKGWSYGVISNQSSAAVPRPWRVVAPVQPDRVADAIVEIQREIADYVRGGAPASEEELARFTGSQIRRLPGSHETRDAVVSEIADMVRFSRPDDWVARKSKAIAQLDLEQVQAAASILDPAQLTWIVVGDLSKIEAPVRALSLGEVTVIDAQGNPVMPSQARSDFGR